MLQLNWNSPPRHCRLQHSLRPEPWSEGSPGTGCESHWTHERTSDLIIYKITKTTSEPNQNSIERSTVWTTLSSAPATTLMPPILSSDLPIARPSFSQHRYSQDYSSLPLKLDIPIPTPVPDRASLPTPPMSGTPTPDPPLDPPQLAGRRRKREETPPLTTQEALSSTIAVENVPQPTEQAAQRYGGFPGAPRAPEPNRLPPPLAMTWDQPAGYGSTGGTVYAQHPAPPLYTTGTQQASPRTTRKTKAHVASACVNCKRKHLRCDETRPCRRCVQQGKEVFVPRLDI